MVRAIFRRPPPFPEGLAAVDRHLRAAGRPIQALCGFEFRNGRQATMQEFMAFNQIYIERMRKADVLVKEQMPLTRSNLYCRIQTPRTESTHSLTPCERHPRPAVARRSSSRAFLKCVSPRPFHRLLRRTIVRWRAFEKRQCSCSRASSACSPISVQAGVTSPGSSCTRSGTSILCSRVWCFRRLGMPLSEGSNGTTSCCRSWAVTSRSMSVQCRQNSRSTVSAALPWRLSASAHQVFELERMPNGMHDRMFKHRVDAIARLPARRILRVSSRSSPTSSSGVRHFSNTCSI